MTQPSQAIKSSLQSLRRRGALEVMYGLKNGSLTFTQIQIKNERQKTFILRDLLASNLITKRDQPTIPATTKYALSELGKALLGSFEHFETKVQKLELEEK
jgi:DNA-binding HxlR family transcriptional regulator